MPRSSEKGLYSLYCSTHQYLLCRAGAQSLGNAEGKMLLLFFITIGTGEVAWANKS
jgi:hypothetical protein